MKLTPFTRDLLKALREEKTSGRIDTQSIKAALGALKTNEPAGQPPVGM